MKNCVVRQAIKDLKDTVIGYELLIQEDESSLYNSSSDNVAANTKDFRQRQGRNPD